MVSSTAALFSAGSSSSSSTGAAAASLDLLDLYFHYHPNVAADVVACVAFALISIPLAILAHRTRMHLSWILVGTALAEAIGYALRAVVINNVSLGPFIITELLILLAPNALALLNYKVLGQVIDIKSPPPSATNLPKPTLRIPFLMDERGLIYGKRIAWIFFTSDVIGFLIQGGGGGLEASSDLQTQKSGARIIMGGLVFQVIFFALFAVLAVYVYYSPLYNRPPTATQQTQSPTVEKPLMDKVFFALFVTIVLILIRNVYRLIEFAVTPGTYIPSSEWLFYVFDMLAIFVAMLVYMRWHFGLYLPNPHTVVSPGHHKEPVTQRFEVAGAELV